MEQLVVSSARRPLVPCVHALFANKSPRFAMTSNRLMMGIRSMIGNMIAESLALSLLYAERLLKDVPPTQFASFGTPGGQTIRSNHGAFIYGHLAIYAPRILKDLGYANAAVPVPENFVRLFSKDAACEHDPSGSIYPSMAEITELFFAGYRAASDALRNTPDELFSQTNPNEAMRSRFATVGSMHAFYCGGHIMVHMGQMSAWRRMFGLPSA